MKRVIGALLILPLLAAAPVPVESDSKAIFIKIDGIVVEGSRDGGIEVLSFDIGRENIGDCQAARGAAGSRNLGDVVLVREIDKASPLLAEAAAKGGSFDEVKIEITGRSACGVTFYQVREMEISQRGGRESITFGYARLDFQPIG